MAMIDFPVGDLENLVMGAADSEDWRGARALVVEVRQGIVDSKELR